MTKCSQCGKEDSVYGYFMDAPLCSACESILSVVTDDRRVFLFTDTEKNHILKQALENARKWCVEHPMLRQDAAPSAIRKHAAEVFGTPLFPNINYTEDDLPPG